MCQHFENTHRRYSPSISGKRKEHQRYFCQVGWSFYYPCPSPADAPASIRPWLALANPLYSPFPGHFSALSSCHVHSSLCSKSFGESIRYSIFEKTVKFGKNIPAQEKIFNENFWKFTEWNFFIFSSFQSLLVVLYNMTDNFLQTTFKATLNCFLEVRRFHQSHPLSTMI